MAIDDVETYSVAPAILFNAVVASLQQLGWRVEAADPATSLVRASTSVSMSTWGEKVTLRVAAAGPNTSTLHTTVALKFGLVDWGKRRRRLAELKGALQAVLSRQGGLTPAGWYPDPYGVAVQRWWDGNAWSGHTS